jgi:hypothetical protein
LALSINEIIGNASLLSNEVGMILTNNYHYYRYV